MKTMTEMKNKPKEEEIVLGSLIESSLNILEKIEKNNSKIEELKLGIYNSGGTSKKEKRK